MAGPTAAVRCDNPECPQVGVQRDVPYAAVGPDLFSLPNLTCRCGCTPRVLDRWNQPTHPATETAVRSAPERRQGRPRKSRG